MKKAFTLIELLVVIAIIATLISILLVALSSSRKASKNTICLNNLRQIATSVQMYVNDYKDVPDAYSIESTVPSANLSTKLANYIDAKSPVRREKEGVWLCPFDRDPWDVIPGSYTYLPFSYRRDYTMAPLRIFENAPLISLMQDSRPRLGVVHLVRFDASAIETNQSTYRPMTQWLNNYRRN